MGRATRGKSQLDRVIAALGIKPQDVVAEAERIAAEIGLPAISRQHLLRLRLDEAETTPGRILLLVMALRELSGRMIRATDLFLLEPQPAFAGGTHGSNACVTVSSDCLTSRFWRLFVDEDTGASDPEAFERLYVEYGLLLRSIAVERYRVPEAVAEELVHDAFIAYLQRHTDIREVKPWLMGAVSNLCKHYWRDQKHEGPLPEGFDPADPAADARAEGREKKLAVAGALSRMGDKCRETLERYYLQEESKESIADRLSVSPGYVLHLLVACRRRLRDLLHRNTERK